MAADTRCRYPVVFILFAVLTNRALAQDNLPHIAVIPFRPISVSEPDAQAISALFETALVNTGVYRVIEQAQMHRILQVQEVAVSDCTDDECAIAIGQLLSAEQIVLGAVVSLEGRYILSAKIVDVAKGVSLKAAKVERDSLFEMTEGAEILAQRLSGLRKSPLVLEGVGSLFVETNPTGAEVFLMVSGKV